MAKGWYTRKTIDIPLKELGFPMFYVRILDPKSHLYGITAKFQELNEDSSREDINEALGEAIAGWNLTDPDTGTSEDPLSGTLLKPPTPDDPGDLDRLPLEFLLEIQKLIADAFTKLAEEPVAKKGTEMQPEDISGAFGEPVRP